MSTYKRMPPATIVVETCNPDDRTHVNTVPLDIPLFGYNLLIIATMMFGVWLLSLAVRDASVVDIFWGLGFVVVAWSSSGLSEVESGRKWLVAGLTSCWGLRLAAHLAWRNLGHPEDPRYRAMRERQGNQFWISSLLTVFGLQGIIMWVVSLPVQAACISSPPLGWLDAIGALTCLTGITWESLADYQLRRFKARPENKGKVLDSGVWRYSRHPNYFGDFLVWWGLFVIAGAGGALWTVVSPLMMSFLLIRVSGVTLLEKSLVDSKPDYVEYIRRTNAFFPGPRKP